MPTNEGPVYKEKYGRWKATVWENEREDDSIYLTGKISRTRKVENEFKEEYTFFPGELNDYRRALDGIEKYMNGRMSELRQQISEPAVEREPGQEG